MQDSPDQILPFLPHTFPVLLIPWILHLLTLDRNYKNQGHQLTQETNEKLLKVE